VTSAEHFRYCPYCRHELGKYQDFQRACPGCGAELYDNVAACAGVFLLNDQDHVLLTTRAEPPYQGSYGIPGGFCSPGESALDTTLREVQEETGLTDFEVLDFIGSFPDRYGDTGSHTLALLFVGRLHSGKAVAADDAASLEWVDLFSLPDSTFADSFPNTREAIKALRVWHSQKGSLR
jgi:ADP-ribose pyrophosphatase YjhB (NUDIX family)